LIKKTVCIIDYFAGNIYSISKAFENFGCKIVLTTTPEQIKKADYLVLPGVGAFGDGMANLKKLNFFEAIQEFCKNGRPFMGICLGMQLLFSSSEEFGNHRGLDIIPGEVKKLPLQKFFKIPHIGWTSLVLPEHRTSWTDSVLEEYPTDQDVYFVHSFAAYPSNVENWLSRTAYGTHWFCSSVQKENVTGYQFHPEKSGEMGLRIINKFLQS